MSSKRSKRKKRKEAFRNYDPVSAIPNEPQKVTKKEITPEYVKLPGQTQVRIGAALLLIGGVLSAGMVYYALSKIQGMNSEEILALTQLNGETPMAYMINLALTSVLAVFEFSFGYPIFKNARNPFYAKKTLIMAFTMLALNLAVNIFSVVNSTNSFNVTELASGCIIPLIIIYGAYKNLKFARNHPDYIAPAPTQMF